MGTHIVEQHMPKGHRSSTFGAELDSTSSPATDAREAGVTSEQETEVILDLNNFSDANGWDTKAIPKRATRNHRVADVKSEKSALSPTDEPITKLKTPEKSDVDKAVVKKAPQPLPAKVPELDTRALRKLTDKSPMISVYLGKYQKDIVNEMLGSYHTNLLKHFSLRWRHDIDQLQKKGLYVDFPKQHVKFVIAWMYAGGGRNMRVGKEPYPEFGSPDIRAINELARHLEIKTIVEDTFKDMGNAAQSDARRQQAEARAAKKLEYETRKQAAAVRKKEYEARKQAAAAKRTEWLSKAVCHNCERTGHVRIDCPEPPWYDGKCFKCGEYGHQKIHCKSEPIVKNPEISRTGRPKAALKKKGDEYLADSFREVDRKSQWWLSGDRAKI